MVVEEVRDRKVHDLTPKEQRDVAANRAYGIPKYDHFGTGALRLVIEEYGAKKTFSEKKERPLAQQLNDFIIALVRAAVLVVRPRRLESEAWQRNYEEQQRRPVIQQRRLRQFEELLTHWKKHEEEVACLASGERVLEGSTEMGRHSTVVEWLEWARKHVGRSDPARLYLEVLASGEAVSSQYYSGWWSK